MNVAENSILIHDIVNEHSQRMLHLKKYYPFFKLQENTLTQYKEGKYSGLDMGYIVMAVLRFFIEENNFNDQAVTYTMYEGFMSELISRDFKLYLAKEESKILVQYIFDKLCNEGKPFVFNFFDPVDQKQKSSRVKLIDSRFVNSKLLYYVTSDAISFYLETKEVQDQSKITTDQLLLEKMIKTQNFKGGLEVVRRINNQVAELVQRKNEVAAMLGHNIFEGVRALNTFSKEGLKWFEEEQKMFHSNQTLVERALMKAGDQTAVSGRDSIDEIHQLESELKRAIHKHSELLAACTDLQMLSDEMIRQAKNNRFRTAIDFRDVMNKILKNDEPQLLEAFVMPLLGINIRKTFNIRQIDDMLSYKPDSQETAELISKSLEQSFKYEDEIADDRIRRNYFLMLRILFEQLIKKNEFTLIDLNYMYEMKFGEGILRNGDYYSFVVHLCQKNYYDADKIKAHQDTFMEGIIKEFLSEDNRGVYKGLKFNLGFISETEGAIKVGENFELSNIRFERVKHDG